MLCKIKINNKIDKAEIKKEIKKIRKEFDDSRVEFEKTVPKARLQKLDMRIKRLEESV